MFTFNILTFTTGPKENNPNHLNPQTSHQKTIKRQFILLIGDLQLWDLSLWCSQTFFKTRCYPRLMHVCPRLPVGEKWCNSCQLKYFTWILITELLQAANHTACLHGCVCGFAVCLVYLWLFAHDKPITRFKLHSLSPLRCSLFFMWFKRQINSTEIVFMNISLLEQGVLKAFQCVLAIYLSICKP